MKQHFGICEWSLPVSGTLAIEIAGEIGFDGMQIGEAGGRKMGYPLNNPRVIDAYKKAAENSGIKLHSLNLGALLSEGTFNFAPDTAEGCCAKESLDKGFDVCRKLGIGSVVITVEPATEEAFENVLRHLAYAEKLSEDSGVTIALESAQPLEDILRLLDRADKRIKICMDVLNPLRFCTGDPHRQIAAFGKDRIDHFHFKDSVKSLFQRGQRGCVLLGTGDAGYSKSVDIIKSLGFEGWMISENYYCFPPMNNGSEDFIALAAADLNTLRTSFSL